MKVFLDTNVLAGAAATRGLCADVLREAFASHELIISEQVLKELRRVLRAKFGVDQDLADDFIRLLEKESVPAQPSELPNIEIEDQEDVNIVGAAISAKAHVLVTGDKELLDLGHVEGLEILSPRKFWEKLKAKRRRRPRGRKPRRSR
jgi:putative PIN family toxin of toxin-antitoxin system